RREGLDQRRELTQWNTGDREVLERAQRLYAVERIVRHVALAEEIVLAARARSGEAKRASASDERGVRRGESAGDRACRASDERRVERRKFLDHLLDLVRREDQRVRALHGARTGPVRGVVEQKTLAERFTDPECHETDGSPLHRLLDRDGARDENRHERAWRALLEEHRIALVRDRRDDPRKLMERGLGDP